MPGAVPTIAQCDTMLKNGCKLLEELRKAFAVTASTNFLDLAKTHTDALVTDYLVQAVAGVERVRTQLAGAIAQGAVKAVLDPVMQSYAQALGVEGQPLDSVFADLRLHFDENAKTVKTRGFTRGSFVASGGLIGSGTIYRLTVDELASGIEDTYAETLAFVCDRDAQSGARRNREEFRVYSITRKARDELQRLGGGVEARLVCSDAGSANIIENAGFDSDEAASPTTIRGWTSSIAVNGTNYEYDETAIYHPRTRSDELRSALVIKATTTLTQRIDRNSRSLQRDVPYGCALHWERSTGAASGTLELHLGAKSVSVVAAAQSGYQRLLLPIGADNWLRQFNEGELDAKIVWTRTGGSIRIDDLILVPMIQIGGLWYFAIGGQTPFRAASDGEPGDRFQIADTETGAVNQTWLWRGGYGYLPHSATPTVADL